MFEHLGEFLLHAVKDTLPLLPWILLIYVLIELLESKADLRQINRFGNKLGPLSTVTPISAKCLRATASESQCQAAKLLTLVTLFQLLSLTPHSL